MSAIFGIIRWDGAQADPDLLQRMQSELRQYGPAEQGFWAEGAAGLGGCITKLGPFEQADVPVLRDERLNLTVAGDAKIYNRDELARDGGLECGEGVSTQAVLLQAYQKWGEDFPKYLNGDFAVAVWDAQKKRLLLARDHTGVRPLYYAQGRSVFAFATDYRALLKLPFVSGELDEVKLYAVLTGTYSRDVTSTFFAQIKRLPQARVLRAGPEGVQLRKYWTPAGGIKTRFPSEAEYARAMADIVQDAVRRRVRYYGGEKLGTELSGGLDSSVVTVLLNREMQKEGLSPAVYSWSPPFELWKLQPRDERIMVELICRQEGLTCRYDDPRQTASLGGQRAAMLTDRPVGEALFRELSWMRAEGVRAVFSGWGGDQAISHRANMFSLLLSGHWGCYLREARREAKGSPVGFLKSAAANAVHPLFVPYGFFGNENGEMPAIASDAFSRRMKRRCGRSVVMFRLNPASHFDSPDIPSRTEMTAWKGAAHQIQYMFPFLDRRVVDFALSIPRHLYFKHGTSRYIYRKTFSKILPEWVARYPHKDDAAMHEYQVSAGLRQDAQIFRDALKPGRFSSYIDWGRVDALLAKGYFSQSTRESRLTLDKLETCYLLERIQEEAKTPGPPSAR